jgi:hypothetical protein
VRKRGNLFFHHINELLAIILSVAPEPLLKLSLGSLAFSGSASFVPGRFI